MQVDTLVIGGGFYGCELALEMKRLGHERVLLVERRAGILERASFVNQARIHNGYHYPRSFATAARSHANFERFIEKYREAVTFDVVMLYAIAKGSRTSPSQFVRFCETIGIPCDVPPRHLERLFDPNLVEASFVVREFAFDSRKLAELLSQRLLGAGVEVRLNSEASVVTAHDEAVTVALGGEQVQARFVFNCTYGDLPFAGIGLRTTLKRELTELLLIRPPVALANVGITVMDGPFFSTMPFPAAGLHALSHVRYTPHWATSDTDARELQPERSNATAMLRDSAHFLPCLAAAQPVRSLFEVKAILMRHEDDDGRPILLEQSAPSARVYSILGSKIDNIFDVLTYISERDWNW